LENSRKKTYVRTMFNSIAQWYDFLNHLLSLGVDHHWRQVAVDMLSTKPGARLLDVAAGSGDLSFAALKWQPELVVGMDIAQKMLERFNEKLRRKNEERIKIICGDVEHSALKDNSFDGAMVAFGVRNFSDIQVGLSEMHRVLKTGGKIVVLEFSQPQPFPIKQLYLFYFHNILPIIGQVFSKNRSAYRYLPDSVSSFPEEEEFVKIIKRVGFVDVTYRNLSFGIVTVYMGTKGKHQA